jgi:hypothetical protein
MIRKRHRLENPVTGRRSTTGVPIGELDRAVGIWTMLPARDGRSLDGQGMDARWRRFRVYAGSTREPPRVRATEVTSA